MSQLNDLLRDLGLAPDLGDDVLSGTKLGAGVGAGMGGLGGALTLGMIPSSDYKKSIQSSALKKFLVKAGLTGAGGLSGGIRGGLGGAGLGAGVGAIAHLLRD